MLFGMGQLIASRGWVIIDGLHLPSRDAAYAAKYRLKKKGLVVESRHGPGSLPVLKLTSSGSERVSLHLQPYRRWKAKWNKRWYMLIYDVPEEDRSYREKLRLFLKKNKMGNLQRSVWVTPFDIRPLYHDLLEASEAGKVSYLFEAQTVLGLPTEEIVTQAWNFERLIELQQDFCTACRKNLHVLEQRKDHHESLFTFAYDAFSTYRYIMDQDPLLPRKLWPAGYLGEEVYTLHRVIQEAVQRKI